MAQNPNQAITGNNSYVLNKVVLNLTQLVNQELGVIIINVRSIISVPSLTGSEVEINIGEYKSEKFSIVNGTMQILTGWQGTYLIHENNNQYSCKKIIDI